MKKEYFSPEVDIEKFDLTVYTITPSDGGNIEEGNQDVTIPF